MAVVYWPGGGKPPTGATNFYGSKSKSNPKTPKAKTKAAPKAKPKTKPKPSKLQKRR